MMSFSEDAAWLSFHGVAAQKSETVGIFTSEPHSIVQEAATSTPFASSCSTDKPQGKTRALLTMTSLDPSGALAMISPAG